MKNKKLFKSLIIIVVLLAVGFSIFMLFDRNRTKGADTKYDDTPYINYDPPTDEEKKAGDEQKQNLEDNPTDGGDNQQDGAKKDANVIITRAEQYGSDIEVSAFVNNHFQDGTCILTFKKDSLIVTKTTPAYRNISTTVCTVPEIKRSEFGAAGDWKVTVTYKSDDAEGTSPEHTITIN